MLKRYLRVLCWSVKFGKSTQRSFLMCYIGVLHLEKNTLKCWFLECYVEVKCDSKIGSNFPKMASPNGKG